MDWVLARLKEPSTHAALAAAAAALVQLVPQPYGGIAVAVLAALGFGISEKQS
jgi:membrane-associated phospholipid phosphatase